MGYALSVSRFIKELERSDGSAVGAVRKIFSFGNPLLNGRMAVALPSLPLAEKEAVSVAQAYPERRVATGSGATRSAFLKALQESEVVHFAGHGLLDQDPGLSGIFLAPGLEVDKGGILFGRDIQDCSSPRLRLIVLSACETSSGNQKRTEGLAGIALAFLEAGAPAVLATQWGIPDESAAAIMTDFHKNLVLGMSGRRALREAQMRYFVRYGRARGNINIWAAYRLIGDV